MVSHNPAKLGAHRHHGNGDINLVCHVISQVSMTQRHSNKIGKSSLRLVIVLPSLVALGTVVVKI